MRYALLLMLSTCAWGQLQANRPDVLWSTNSDAIAQSVSGKLTMPENVSVGDLIDVCVVQHVSLGSQYAPSDTLGNTWTLTAITNTPGSGTTETNPTTIYHAYTFSAFSGADTFNANIPGANTTNNKLAVMAYKGLGSVDGSVAVGTFVGNGSGGTGTVSTSNTTTVNNDVLSSCGAPGTFGTAVMTWNTNEYGTAGENQNGNRIFMGHQHTTTLGAQTVTANTYNDAVFGADSFAMQTLAFKPSAITVPDTTLPDAGSGITYFAQLHCSGGAASQSWTHTSGVLPTGLSFNTANGQITGSTTSTGTTSQGFTCTDGTSTSATTTLSLRVNATLGVPTVRQIFPNNADTNGAWTPTPSGSCNDILVVAHRGTDTHYREGWIQSLTGSGNSLSDAFGSSVFRILGDVPGTYASPLAVGLVGPLQKTGIDTITLQNNQGGSSANPISLIFDISGGELVDNAIGTSVMTHTASGTFGGSYTTTVPNTLLLTVNMTDINTTPASTLSMASPWTTQHSGGDASGVSLYTSTLVSSPGTQSATVTYGNGNTTFSTWAQLVIPIRPAPSLVSCPLAAGEQILEWVY